jgi:hypothetical protein
MSDSDTDIAESESVEWEQITIPKPVYDRLNHKRGVQSWGDYLDELRMVRDDPITLNDGQEIAEYVQEEIDVDMLENVNPALHEVSKKVNSQRVEIDALRKELQQTNSALEKLIENLED